MKGGKQRRVITSFAGSSQKRSAAEQAAEKKRTEVQKIKNALKKR